MMIATEPLPEQAWQQIGLANRETFADPRRTVTYAQRTADGRLAAGSRGNYFFGSGIRDRFASDDSTFDDVRQVYESMLPVLRDYEITHRWGGPLGVPRDWLPRVGIDRKAGLGWAGGYVGEGVAASNLAARTLADLILQRNSDRVALPWVASRFPKWEPEPLRWIASSALTRLARSLDESEFSGREAPRLRQAVFKSFVRK
jgi:glycine/D-amino acid oxidase-like deaminating enzyme